MSFKPYRGKWMTRWFRKKASTAFTEYTLVADSSDIDTIEPADSSDAEVRGIMLRTVTSADSDYASTTRVPVLVPESPFAELIGDTSTIAITDEGNEVDLTDASTANAAASSTDILKLTQFVSSTKGVFIINKLGLG